MSLRVIRFLPILFLALWAAPPVTAPADDPARAIVRRAVDNYFAALPKLNEFCFERRSERREYDSGGKLKSQRAWVAQIDFVDGVRASWPVEENGQPIAPDKQRDNEDQMRRRIAEWKAKTPEERKQIRDKSAKGRRSETDYLKEFPDALNFIPTGSETINGRETFVFRFEPRPGYKAKAMEGRVYEKVRGSLWIDKAENHMAKMTAEVYDTVSVGGFLARIDKGTRFELQQARVEPGLWFSTYQSIRFDVRIMIVKTMHQLTESHFRNYRRYTGEVFAE